jgi:ABC-type bacteriocin/lantibiotic exporter with double-glycine peptidase domain
MSLNSRAAFTRWDFARFLACRQFYFMIGLIVVESLLAAATTYLVIKAGRDVANDEFLVGDLLWIVAAQSTSYIVGAVSWVFAEQAGFGAYGRYMLRFSRDNRHQNTLLHDKPVREQIEPFLTSETFHIFFELMYELEADLKIFFGLVFNALVIGLEIDAGLPVAYAVVFVILLFLQWSLRKPVAYAYLTNQRMTNRMTSHSYTAWDNIFSGNAYNFRLWHGGFKVKLRDALRAQIRAIVTREGLSTVSGIIGLGIVFTTMTYVASQDLTNTVLLAALAVTLPRQIEMTNDVHLLASGWNDLLAIWTRIGGAVDNMRPQPDSEFNSRIKFDRLLLRQNESLLTCDSVDQAMEKILAQPAGRINVRGDNGSGKSTLLLALKAALKNRAYYWPTADRLAFRFAGAVPAEENDEDDETENETSATEKPGMKKSGFSSGERQLQSLREIVTHTDAGIYLLDEWDANLDPANRAAAAALINQLAARARVVEISHRDSEWLDQD